MSALQLAIQSFIKKFLRGLVATALLALASAIPVIQDAFAAAGVNGDIIEKAVYGVLVTGLAAALAFVQKLLAAQKPVA